MGGKKRKKREKEAKIGRGEEREKRGGKREKIKKITKKKKKEEIKRRALKTWANRWQFDSPSPHILLRLMLSLMEKIAEIVRFGSWV